MKKVIIPWSGGVDSTYLVWKNLSEGNEVSTISVQLENNKTQQERESKAREKIYDYLRREFPNCRLYRDNNLSKISVVNGSNTILAQPPIWILFSMYSHNFCDMDEVQMGYVMNDDAISYLSEIKRLYNSYQPLINCKLPTLSFPLSKKKKSDLMGEIPEELLSLVEYCEYDGGTNCTCLCCERHHKELRESTKYYLARALLYTNEEKYESKPVEPQLEIEFQY